MKRIRHRILLPMLGGIVILFAFGGYESFEFRHFWQRAARDEIQGDLRAMAANISVNLAHARERLRVSTAEVAYTRYAGESDPGPWIGPADQQTPPAGDRVFELAVATRRSDGRVTVEIGDWGKPVEDDVRSVAERALEAAQTTYAPYSVRLRREAGDVLLVASAHRRAPTAGSDIEMIAIVAAVPIESLPAIRIVRRRWPPGSAAVLTDLEGRVVYHSSAPQSGRGTMRADFRELRSRKDCDLCDIVDVPPIRRTAPGEYVRGAARIQGAPYLLVFEVPADALPGPFLSSFTRRITTFLAVACMMTVVAFGTSTSISRPIEGLRQDTLRLSAGDLRYRSKITASGEVGELVRAFNTMAAELETRDSLLRERDAREAHLRRLEAVGTFAATIAHDFGNYLHSIMTQVYLVEQGLVPGSRSKRDLQEVGETVQRAAQLVRRILDFSRTSATDRRLVDVSELLERSIPMLHALLPPAVVFETAADTHVPIHIRADPVALEQALVNIVANARDAIRGEGSVVLAVRRAMSTFPASTDDDRERREQQEVIIEITDSGSGMPDAVRERILEPFYTTKAPGLGTGLGMAIVASAVASGDGSVAIESTVGVGTTVTLRFPIADQSISWEHEMTDS